jgi:hypothetical protein
MIMSDDRIFPSSKKLNIGVTSSLLDLKAELLARKNAATSTVKSEKQIQTSQPKWKEKADQLEAKGELDKIKPKRKIKNRDKKTNQETISEEDRLLEENLKKSRESLERKTKQYEELYQKARQGCFGNDSSDEEDHESGCLINFVEKAHLHRFQESVNVDDDDEVEFTDAFGRTRKCLRKDLPNLQKLDQEAKQSVQEKLSREIQDQEDDDDMIGPMPPSEMELPPTELKASVRYTDLAQDEVRDHGVGFFKFSTNEDERRAQREMLDNLRKETMQQRKELKRQRRLKRAAEKGVDVSELEPSSDEEEEQPTLEERLHEIEMEKRVRDINSLKETLPRDWDVGKKDERGKVVKVSSSALPGPSVSNPPLDFNSTDHQKSYVPSLDRKYIQERRQERDEMFAPPSSYFFDQSAHPQGFQGVQTTKKQKTEINPRDIEKVIADKLAFFKKSS